MPQGNAAVSLGKTISLFLITTLAGSLLTVAFNTPVAPIGEASAQAGGQGQQPLSFSFKYTFFSDLSGCMGQWCGTNIETRSFTSSASLYPFEDGYAGNGTGLYEEREDRDTDPVPPACPQRGSYHALTSGPAIMQVNASPRGLNYTVQVTFTGEYRYTWEKSECGQYESHATEFESSSHTCDFYEVDLEKGGTYELIHTEEGSRCTMTISPAGGEKINVRVEPSELNPKYNLNQTAVLKKLQAKVTVTLTRGGAPWKNEAILIKVCTLPGTKTTDGHIEHDKRDPGWEKNWSEPCNQGERPSAIIKGPSGKNGNLLVERTNSNGQVILDYYPPKYKTYQYIAGTDEITATALHDAPHLQDKATIITKVPDLIQMPGSSNCNGAPNYNFGAQSGSKHGCIFYSTSQTSQALQSMAAEFMQRQQDCKNNSTSGACLVSYSGSPHNVTITGSPVPMRINAMTLPWGGLTDNVGGVAWRPPHQSHNDGRQVDLSFGIFQKTGVGKNNSLCSNLGPKCANYDIDRIMLLRDVIQNSPNFYRFPSYEGGDLAATFKDKAPHIHIFFNQ